MITARRAAALGFSSSFPSITGLVRGPIPNPADQIDNLTFCPAHRIESIVGKGAPSLHLGHARSFLPEKTREKEGPERFVLPRSSYPPIKSAGFRVPGHRSFDFHKQARRKDAMELDAARFQTSQPRKRFNTYRELWPMCVPFGVSSYA